MHAARARVTLELMALLGADRCGRLNQDAAALLGCLTRSERHRSDHDQWQERLHSVQMAVDRRKRRHIGQRPVSDKCTTQEKVTAFYRESTGCGKGAANHCQRNAEQRNAKRSRYQVR